MKVSVFEAFISAHQERLAGLLIKDVYIVANISTGKLLNDGEAIEKNCGVFNDDDDIKVLSTLITSSILDEYNYSMLLDLGKAVGVYKQSDLPENEKIKTAVMMARVNFMGTDGIRGKVVLETDKDLITAVLEDNAFTKDLVETCSYSFAQLLKNQQLAVKGDFIVLGNDGRDVVNNWDLKKALIAGMNRAGLHVLDLGVVPTALVPLKMIKEHWKGGAVLTASHNPSNQNGIKFFIDGKKLLPEGALGDYVLSALMFKYCYLEKIPKLSEGISKEENIFEEGLEFLRQALPENSVDLLKGTKIILDTANGAFHDLSKKILETLGVDYVCVNEDPAGDNINRSCGVAEIEGNDLFEASSCDSAIPIIKILFKEGRKADKDTVYGVALDGDGDRGFLLVYDKPTDCIHVVDGDKCGYILSQYLLKIKGVDPKDVWFISTIESDLLTSASAEKKLGLNTKVVSVGDKWICNFAEGDLLVGLEISGHVIYPITICDKYGDNVVLMTGVGLLTGLLTLLAAKDLCLSRDEIIEPFKPGFSKTFYVFFVDKSRFYKNSSVWLTDIELIKEASKELQEQGYAFSLEEKEDENVLYLKINNGNGALAGCIFIRNSGTEDKTACYVKGEKEIEMELLSIGQKIQSNHAKMLKNERRLEYSYEKFIMSEIEPSTSLSVECIVKRFSEKNGISVLESDIFSVIHGLRKEGRVLLDGTMVSKNYHTKYL